MPVGDSADVDAAVAVARRAFDGGGWSDLDPLERADALERFADEMQKRSALIAENGMPNGLSFRPTDSREPGSCAATQA
ncbi:aldehyde dehydrogenase family protein [Streptomyces coeruleorubidus]|uniref:aldehyde dehydrogenase family protein n=1 Tax=Streptomyces coeruleorubidus TaxID=116188 RepID=UPI0036851654